MVNSAPSTVSSKVGSTLSTMAFPSVTSITDDTQNESIRRLLTRSLNHQNENGLIHVSTPLLFVTAIPLLVIAFIGHQIDPSLSDSLGIGVIRSFIQLMTLGVILNPIFKWGMAKPWIVSLCK